MKLKKIGGLISLGIALCALIFTAPAAAEIPECPDSIWSGAKRVGGAWKVTQSQVSGPTQTVSGARVECHYDNINDTVYVWQRGRPTVSEDCPDSIWAGAKRAPEGWNETQTLVEDPDRRTRGRRVECHYPNPDSVYIWRMVELNECPESYWSGAKNAPAGWNETQTLLSGATRSDSGSRVECRYDNINETVYIWRNDLAPASVTCPASLWTGPKNGSGDWNETQTLVDDPEKRVGAANRVECHYVRPPTVYVWQ